MEVNNEDTEAKDRFSGIKSVKSGIKRTYEEHYKILLIIPFTILLIAILLIGFRIDTTGDFVDRDVSIKGGVTVTIPITEKVDILQLKNTLSSRFPANDMSTKSVSQLGTEVGVIIEADIEEKQVNSLIDEIGKALNLRLTTKDYTVEIIGPSLGASFFKELMIAVVLAFLLMVVVVFLYFRTIVPSALIILTLVSDMVVTLAAINLLGMRLSAAGIAAFLMLIGYCIDDNIMLTIRVLKRKEGTEMERIYGALKTGVMMSATTIVAVTVALMITDSEVIKQIMTIMLIGLSIDLINTWIQNVGILRLYTNRLRKKNERAMAQ